MKKEKKKIDISIKNREAYFNYYITDKVIAGIMLEGSEIKSLITGQVNINQSYITIHDNRVVIKNMYIKNIQNNAFSHTETRDRVLLLTKQQIKKWEKELKVRGTSIMCLSLFYDGKRFKMEIGIGTGKKNYDKRETIKQRDISRENN